MSIRQELKEIGQKARAAALELSAASAIARQSAIERMAARLISAHDEIMQANQLDMAKATSSGTDDAFLKRLQISEKIFSYMHERLLEAAKLPDPLGIVLEGHLEPSGLQVSRVSVPLGVIGIIYEARPNVTTDAAAVALKSGNAVILRAVQRLGKTKRRPGTADARDDRRTGPACRCGADAFLAGSFSGTGTPATR